jgi:hypothetical protein
MSIKEYLKNRKNESKVSLENYKQSLYENLAIFLGTKEESLDIKENLINEIEIKEETDKLGYPNSNSLVLSLKTQDIKEVILERNKLLQWAQKNEKEIEKIKKTMAVYESYMLSKEVTRYVIEKLVESCLAKTEMKINELSLKIDNIKNKIKWPFKNILIEAIYPAQGLLAVEADVSLGEENVQKVFSINLETKEIELNDEMPQRIKNKCSELVSNLNERKKEKVKFINLYMPILAENENKILESKKEIILGMKQYLPHGTKLMKEPIDQEGATIWKVRINENQLKKDGEEYLVIAERAELFWVGKHEK